MFYVKYFVKLLIKLEEENMAKKDTWNGLDHFHFNLKLNTL